MLMGLFTLCLPMRCAVVGPGADSGVAVDCHGSRMSKRYRPLNPIREVRPTQSGGGRFSAETFDLGELCFGSFYAVEMGKTPLSPGYMAGVISFALPMMLSEELNSCSSM